MNQIVTLGFVEAEIFEFTMRHLYEDEMLSQKYDHYFLDQHFPIDRKNNVQRLRKTCDQYGIIWIDSLFDRGLHEGFNYLMTQIPIEPGGRFIGMDPDEYPVEKGWDLALLSALDHTDVAACCLNNTANMETPGCDFEHRGGLALPINRPTMMGVTAWKWDFLKATGGLQQPTSHWGHLESWLWMVLANRGMRYAITKDFHSCGTPVPQHNPLYTQYKRDQADFKNRIGLKEWLVQNGHI